VTVATLGPPAAEEQLRACLALGASAAVLLETEPGAEVGPIATAAALHSVAAGTMGAGTAAAGTAGAGGRFDLVLLGNEASDTGDYQVGIRLAHLLGWPVATGIKALSADDAGVSVTAARTYRAALETFALALPCVVTVKEGINLPRYPSLPGRLRAKRAAITRMPVPGGGPGGAVQSAGDVRMTSLRVPDAPKKQATVLGQGAAAVPALVDVLVALGVVS
jgi:electron transfer flavoprotein beta subunit